MFYRIKVCRLLRPVHALNSIVLQELFHYPCPVKTGIIIHENENFHYNFCIMHHVRFKDFIPVPHFCNCFFWDHVEKSTETISDKTLRHGAASPITDMLQRSKNLSPSCLQTFTRHALIFIDNLPSSLNKTRRHCCWVHPTWPMPSWDGIFCKQGWVRSTFLASWNAEWLF